MELAVVIGISGILVLAAATIFTLNSNQNARATAMTDTVQLMQEIQGLLQSPTTCGKILGAGPPTNTTIDPTVPSANVIIYQADGITPRFGLGLPTTYGAIHELTVSNVIFYNSSGSLTTQVLNSIVYLTGYIQMNIVNALNPSLVKINQRQIPITLQINTTGNLLLGCSATNPANLTTTLPICVPGQMLTYSLATINQPPQWNCIAVPP
jgi:hypothetical protein